MLRRETIITPAYNHKPPGGRGCAELLFYLHGPGRCVSFTLFTGWYVDETGDPRTCDLSAHSKIPVPNGMNMSDGRGCMEWDTTCYRYTSGLAAKPLLSILRERGSRGVWDFLEDFYYKRFTGICRGCKQVTSHQIYKELEEETEEGSEYPIPYVTHWMCQDCQNHPLKMMMQDLSDFKSFPEDADLQGLKAPRTS